MTTSPEALREAVRLAELAKQTFIATLKTTTPCPRCSGIGAHHGFGEDGNDPDWCLECGGSGFTGPSDDDAWMAVGQAMLGTDAVRLSHLCRLAASGTVDSFMACDDETKRLAFALLCDESSRRKAAEVYRALSPGGADE